MRKGEREKKGEGLCESDKRKHERQGVGCREERVTRVTLVYQLEKEKQTRVSLKLMQPIIEQRPTTCRTRVT